MNGKKLTVFISSTVSDIPEYRAAAVDVVLRAGQIPISLESLPASDSRPIEVIGEMLRSADVVMFIIGNRYGAVIESLGISWTEFEFEQALGLRKQVVVFLIDQRIGQSEKAKWPDADRVFEGRLQAFRERVRKKYLAQCVKSIDDFAFKAASALAQLTGQVEEPKEASRLQRTVDQIRIARLLISSPGDVSRERDRVERAVFRFNQTAVEAQNLFIKVIRWEDLPPQIGPGAQAVVNRHLENYHIFVGIMWNRFGTKTERASSGTEEEFNAAISSWKLKSRPWITFYFCERKTWISDMKELRQKKKVLEFRSRLEGTVRTYQTPAEFEGRLYQDLLRITSTAEFQNILE